MNSDPGSPLMLGVERTPMKRLATMEEVSIIQDSISIYTCGSFLAAFEIGVDCFLPYRLATLSPSWRLP